MTVPTTTAQGTSQYAIPTGMTAISHLYWLETAGGTPVTMESYDIQELRRMFGDGANAQQGKPRYFAVVGTKVQVFPTPDDNGGSNYTLNFEGYTTLVPITETTGTTTTGGASTTLTIPSTGYLTALGVASSGTYLSIVGAGYAGSNSVASTLLTTWTAFGGGGTTVTISPGAQAVATSGKCFFNSSNWLIQNFDHVVLFGVLREVAAYLKENFQTWDQRFEAAYDDMARHDVDRRKTLEMDGVAVTGQRQTELGGRRNYWGFYGW